MADVSDIKIMMAERELARRSLRAHIEYKFKYFYKKPLLKNWHIDYTCELLDGVLAGDITRLILNMPPSYGKTEIVGRSFIPYAVGRYNDKKFIYTSYGDELSKKTSDDARLYFKSKEFLGVFAHENLATDQTTQWRLPQGGGLYATTTGGAITGFHGHIIINDDPMKASEATSKAVRNKVYDYFTDSLLSRLDETAEKKASIVIIMQRLHKDDLCGILLKEHASDWMHVNLVAINERPTFYTFGKFSYERAQNEPLFIAKHTLEDLQTLRAQMGAVGFASQYQQDPSEAEGGVFEETLFCGVNDFELPELSEYIFVDSAESLKQTSDDRAIVCEGWAIDEEQRELCVMLDCKYGKWDEDTGTNEVINMMLLHKKASVYIEAAGGGITFHRLLMKKITMVNAKLKKDGKEPILNPVYTFAPRRDISKNAGIMAMLTYYNVGQLKFRNSALGLEQIKKELKKFNPEKTSNEDNCIDALSKGFILPNVVRPKQNEIKQAVKNSRFAVKRTWRI
ncbi:hypothetical protein [Campylobacter curvus]|uniref:hypothetical protein n=1 Tax=Campylobacter curvus TaxID=200 RepID=UPI00146FD17B|nr:hypothetical protein [Campylobacter curvus]